MNKNFVNMHRNVAKIKKLPYCKIRKVDRYGLGIEALLREGKYKVFFDYQVNGQIDAYLVEPKIDMSDYIGIHTYGLCFHKAYNRKLPKLCLNLPYKWEWDSSILLIDSYIPWAVEWTEFYEIWKLTGKWHGGGKHPCCKRGRK